MGTNRKKRQKRQPPANGAARPSPRHRHTVILIVILAVGLLLRAGYLAEMTRLPDFDQPLVDAQYHDYWARSIVAGSWEPPENEPDPEIGSHPYFRPPGYPFFLSGIYAVFGPGYLAPRIVQMLLGLLGVLLVFALARRLFDETTGLVAAGLAAVYWGFIYFEGEFLEPVLSIPLIVSFVLLLLRWRDRPSLAAGAGAGLLLGLLILVRPNAVALAPVAGAWMIWVGHTAARRTRPVRDFAILLGAAAAVVLPVTVRNYVVSGDFVLVSSNAGINLLIGNSARADGEVRGTIPGVGTLDTSFDYPEIVRRVERMEGRPMSHAEVGRYLAARAWDEIKQDPARTLRLMARKTALFWGPDEVADNKVVALDRAHSKILHWLPLSFAIVLSLGLLGLARAAFGSGRAPAGAPPLAERRDLWLVVAVVLVWFATHLPVAVTSRYRLPVVPFLIVFAALFLRWLAASVAARRYRPVVPWAIALVVVLVISHVDLAGYEDNVARWHYQRAIAFQRSGDLGSAVDEYREALRLNRDYGAVYNDLAAALATQGRIEESVPYFRKALEFNPADPSVHLNLAMALEAIGRSAESHERYREVLRLSPNNAQALAGLERTRGPGDGPPSDPSP
jgi:tetratricopeptide (TPR) repeat protein